MSSTLVLVLALVLLITLVVAVGTAMRARSRQRSGLQNASLAADTAIVPHDDGQGTETLGLDDLVLVPLPNHRREALVIGREEALAVLDASGLTQRPDKGGAGSLPQLVRSGMAAGGLEATRRAQNGVDSGRLVALSKETMEHLDKGKISHVMRLDKKGAQAVVASNAATLAVTAALSQQLEQLAEQLAEISETLEGMVRDKDRERLSEVLAANEVLMDIGNNVRRRGITDADAHQLAALKLPVIAKQIEAEFKFDEVLGESFEELTRGERFERLEALVDKERLDYWLAVRVQADLARTRADLLTLY
jgi:hypothetical protein